MSDRIGFGLFAIGLTAVAYYIFGVPMAFFFAAVLILVGLKG